MKLRAVSLLSAGLVAWVLTLPAIATAVPVFKYDTTYKITGQFDFGTFGKLTLTEDSFLHYDSNAEELTISAQAVSNKYKKDGFFYIDYLVGAANPKQGAVQYGDIVQFEKKAGTFNNPGGAMVEFDYHPDAKTVKGDTQIGEFYTDFRIKNRDVNANQKFDGFSMYMKPFLTYDNQGRVYLQSWLMFSGHKWNVSADPGFYLTELPNTPPVNEIPEPFTMGLLATGLLGGAAVRRRNRN